MDLKFVKKVRHFFSLVGDFPSASMVYQKPAYNIKESFAEEPASPEYSIDNLFVLSSPQIEIRLALRKAHGKCGFPPMCRISSGLASSQARHFL